MRLVRLLRGAASAGPGPGQRSPRPGASRSLTSGSGSGLAPPEGGVPGQVDFYARFSPSPLSMKQFLDFGECGPGLGPLCAASSPLSPATPPRPPPPPAPPTGLRCFLPPSRADPAAQVRNWGRVPFLLCAVEKPKGPRGWRWGGGITVRLAAHVPGSTLGPGPSPRPLPLERLCEDTSWSRVSFLQIDDKCPVLCDDCINLAGRSGRQVITGPVFPRMFFLLLA